LIWIKAKSLPKPNFGMETLQPAATERAYPILYTRAEIPLEFLLPIQHLRSAPVASEVRKTMPDLAILALVVAAFAAAAAYAGLCNQLARRPETPDEDH
jgi:hypothetical protein